MQCELAYKEKPNGKSTVNCQRYINGKYIQGKRGSGGRGNNNKGITTKEQQQKGKYNWNFATLGIFKRGKEKKIAFDWYKQLLKATLGQGDSGNIHNNGAVAADCRPPLPPIPI